jgi:hypothetical protein
MTTQQLLLVTTCVYIVAMLVTVYCTRATTRRLVGALAGGGAVAVVGVGVELLCQSLGFWRYPSTDSRYGPPLMYPRNPRPHRLAGDAAFRLAWASSVPRRRDGRGHAAGLSGRGTGPRGHCLCFRSPDRNRRRSLLGRSDGPGTSGDATGCRPSQRGPLSASPVNCHFLPHDAGRRPASASSSTAFKAPQPHSARWFTEDLVKQVRQLSTRQVTPADPRLAAPFMDRYSR